MMIHPLACVSAEARLGTNVTVGPFSVIEPDVEVGDHCQLASHVVVKSGTTLGPENRISEGAVLGGLPQHTRAVGPAGRLTIGSRNVIREHVTVHRSLQASGETRIGDDCLIMVGSHVAHDCQVGDRVVMTNHVLLGGHVSVGGGAYLGGAAAVHQFCRVGRLAMIGGMARVKQDVPPFVTVDGGTTQVVGLNLVGLRRAGMTSDKITQLKDAYSFIYRRGRTWRELGRDLARTFPSGVAAEFAPFFAAGTRGFVQERRPPRDATIRLHQEDPQEDPTHTVLRQAG